MNEADARAEFMAVMREQETRPVHVQHVTRLALQLFDGLGALHGLGPHERLLLDAAGHLHDIGHQVRLAGTGHHKESARLIREHAWKHFNPLEVEMVAQVARYHRKAMPDFRHEDFRGLSERDRDVVLMLSAILRLADGLDRSHRQLVLSIAVEAPEHRVLLRLTTAGPAPREMEGAREKADLATAVFRREFQLVYGEPPRHGSSALGP